MIRTSDPFNASLDRAALPVAQAAGPLAGLRLLELAKTVEGTVR